MTTETCSLEQKSDEQKKCCCGCLGAQTLAFLLLRLWLAMRALVTVLEKFRTTKQVELLDEFGNPDISGAMRNAKTYAIDAFEGTPKAMEAAFLDQPLIPSWALGPYGYAISVLFVLAGLGLLLGICTRASLFVMGLVYITLAFGFVLYGGVAGDQGIASMAIHLILVVLALYWCDRHNKFTLTKC